MFIQHREPPRAQSWEQAWPLPLQGAGPGAPANTAGLRGQTLPDIKRARTGHALRTAEETTEKAHSFNATEVPPRAQSHSPQTLDIRILPELRVR